MKGQLLASIELGKQSRYMDVSNFPTCDQTIVEVSSRSVLHYDICKSSTRVVVVSNDKWEFSKGDHVEVYRQI